MRHQLEDRRPSVTTKTNHQNYSGSDLPVIITCGFSGGRVREVFTASFKAGSDSNALAGDGCVLISLLLQHGYTPELLLHKLCNPPSLLGSILRAAADLDRSCAIESSEISCIIPADKEKPVMSSKFHLNSASYVLNPLVNQARDARLPNHIGTCKECSCPVSAYEHEPSGILKEVRPSSSPSGEWAACDNSDCSHAQGSQYPDYEEWVQK